MRTGFDIINPKQLYEKDQNFSVFGRYFSTSAR